MIANSLSHSIAGHINTADNDFRFMFQTPMGANTWIFERRPNDDDDWLAGPDVFLKLLKGLRKKIIDCHTGSVLWQEYDGELFLACWEGEDHGWTIVSRESSEARWRTCSFRMVFQTLLMGSEMPTNCKIAA